MSSSSFSKLNCLTGIAGAAMVAIVLAADPASAQPVDETVKVAFAYHPGDPAEKIYTHLQAIARDACTDHGSRSLRRNMAEKACARDLLDRAVAGIDRADLAQLHHNSLATFASNQSTTAQPVELAAR
jgi:UrcA family protein